MFQMMNEARIGTALIGLANGSAAYQNALSYARERVQGTHISKIREPGAPKVAIIEHPAVRYNLLQLTGKVEGMPAKGIKELISARSVIPEPPRWRSSSIPPCVTT